MTDDATLPSVSVVTPTGGRREIFQKTFRAALADPATSQLIVVLTEKPETPAGEEFMEELRAEDPRVVVIRQPDLYGGLSNVQVSREAGMIRAESEVVLALDDDVVLRHGAVTGHARAHSQLDRAVVVGYMPVVTKHPWPLSNAPIRHYGTAYLHHCDVYDADPSAILLQLWGGNVSLRRDDWRRATQRPRQGCWGHDDQELGLLFLREGLVAHFDRDLRGDHFYERSWAGFVERAELSTPAHAALIEANRDLLPEPVGPGVRKSIAGPFLWLSRTALGWWVLRWSLIAVITLLGALGLHAAEDRGAAFLWTLAGMRSSRALAGS